MVWGGGRKEDRRKKGREKESVPLRGFEVREMLGGVRGKEGIMMSQ